MTPLSAGQLSDAYRADVLEILRTVLYEFPVAEACFRMPEWMDVLPPDNAVKQQLYARAA